jgi:hypothetical protein
MYQEAIANECGAAESSKHESILRSILKERGKN